MRLIGHLKNEALARTFSRYLTSVNIRNSIEAETEGWAVWVQSEDQIEAGRQALAAYESNPADRKYAAAMRRAEEVERQERQEEAKAAKRIHGRDSLLSRSGAAPLTLALVGLSVGVWLATALNPGFNDMRWLAISTAGMGFDEIRAGQVWRLITPIFVHFGPIHLLFNMMWLYDLGSMIELRRGTFKLGLMVLILGVASNVGQYVLAGPYFGGMSGVLYGLFGYIWLRGRCEPFSGLALSPTTVWMMLAWYFLCLFGVIPNVANIAHTAGLVLGALWGAAPMAGRWIRG
jgi:GlpG protein